MPPHEAAQLERGSPEGMVVHRALPVPLSPPCFPSKGLGVQKVLGRLFLRAQADDPSGQNHNDGGNGPLPRWHGALPHLPGPLATGVKGIGYRDRKLLSGLSLALALPGGGSQDQRAAKVSRNLGVRHEAEGQRKNGGNLVPLQAFMSLEQECGANLRERQKLGQTRP